MHESSDNSRSTWRVWQVLDSAFPIGGFAHSGGLEAAVQMSVVHNGETLAAFIEMNMEQAARLAAAFVAASHEDASRFDELNRRYDTLLTNDPANRASRALGAAVLAVGETIDRDGLIGSARRSSRAARSVVHYPPAFGLLMRVAGLDADTAVDAFLFQQARTLLSAAVRLGVIGPMESQRMLTTLTAGRDRWLAIARQTSVDTAVQCAPMLDVLQSLHERLYSRLFNS